MRLAHARARRCSGTSRRRQPARDRDRRCDCGTKPTSRPGSLTSGSEGGLENPSLARRQGAPIRPLLHYIPVTAGSLYLVAVMDWPAVHVLALRLSNTMGHRLCLDALEAALRMGTPEIFTRIQGNRDHLTAPEFQSRRLIQRAT